jgi:hypothetical protein
MDIKAGQIMVDCQGALQNKDIRQAVCKVMEGGVKLLTDVISESLKL